MKAPRIQSIDIFRGLTMILMTIVNNPGDWDNVFPPFLHAHWHGCTPTDLVFPFFVFTMGMAVPFAVKTQTTLDKALFIKILTRSLRIFNLGLFLNFFSKIHFFGLEGIPLMVLRLAVTVLVGVALLGNFSSKTKLVLALSIFFGMIGLAFLGPEDFANVRIPGVLQRIGIVYFLAMLIQLTLTFKWRLVAAAVLLLGYWAAMGLIQVPGVGAANYEVGTNLAAWLDNFLLPGHLWASSKTWDPEGILSTFPAVVTVLLGIWTTEFILSKPQNLRAKLFGIGLGLLLVAKLWDVYFPINKALWTSSYVLYAGGWAILVFTLIEVVFGVKEKNKVASFLVMWGVNPMIVFFGSGIVPRALNMIKVGPEQEGLTDYIYFDWISPLFSEPKVSSLVGALCFVGIWTVILLIFKKKNLIFKV
ncbi:acyltransferase family protein [Lacihabitans lacunae]|uniref:Acyltransferase family protein n=1 Tax=Lacihabitans lacunae TaxID=1028214 RepID=A0ABV7YWD1_9BACT